MSGFLDDDELKVLQAEKLAAAVSYRAAIEQSLEGGAIDDERCAALGAAAYEAHMRYHRALSMPTHHRESPARATPVRPARTMRVEIRAPFPVTWVPADGSTITTRVIFGASRCEARREHGVVRISHPTGDFQLAVAKFQSLLRQGNLALLDD